MEELIADKNVDSSRSSESISLIHKKESSKLNAFEKHFKGVIINELDIESQINTINNLPCCLNNYLEETLKTPKGFSLLLEIRNRNIKINMSKTYYGITVCQWCKDNCLNKIVAQTEEISFKETNTKICCCSVENHDINHIENKFNLNSDDKKEIQQIINIYSDNTIPDFNEKIALFKKKIENIIEKKDNDKMLEMICYMLNIDLLKVFFYQLKYNDNIFVKLLPCIKKYKGNSYLDNIMSFYCDTYIFRDLIMNEQPIYIINNSQRRPSAVALFCSRFVKKSEKIKNT